MSESRPTPTEADLEAVRVLQEDESSLDRIESLLDRFNIFEAIGFIDQELMHSRFLVFLLDPKQYHGLGDLFLKRVLRQALVAADKPSLPALFENLDEMDLSQTLVRREHQHVDILLTNEAHSFAVIIENKIWTTEHSNQLNRYYQAVKTSHPGWQVFGIYLTPLGDIPSHEGYVPLGYGMVCETIDSLVEDNMPILSPAVRMAIEHYTDMVRRNIMSDSEITSLCRRLYQEHQRAFDLVFQYRFAQQEFIRKILIRLVREVPGLIPDGGWINYPSASYVDFAVQEWDVPKLQVGSRNDRGNRILEFVFGNYPDHLILDLQIRPGDEQTRGRLFGMAHAHPDVFNGAKDSSRNYSYIFRRIMLRSSFYEDSVRDNEREREIRRRWAEFLREDLPRIDAALKEQRWIWESVEADEEPSSRSERFVWRKGDIKITGRSGESDPADVS